MRDLVLHGRGLLSTKLCLERAIRWVWELKLFLNIANLRYVCLRFAPLSTFILNFQIYLMKKTASIFLLCLLLSFSAFAQDWNLIAPAMKYNFRLSTANYVTNTIRVDSAAALGADSVFWLSQPKSVFFSSYPYLLLVGNILGDSVVKHPGAIYECRFRPPLYYPYPQETAVIHTKALIGASWEFTPGVIATVTEQTDTLCWGVADSVKTISLSDGKSIRLSKKFGVLSLENQTLIGLQGENIGVQLPVMGDFYQDWVSGAVFEQLGTNSTDYTSSTKTWTKYYVLGKTVTADSIKISVRKLVRREQYFIGQLTATTFEDKLDLFVVVNPSQVQYPGTVKDPNYGNFTSTYYENTAAGLQLTVQSVNPPSSSGPSRNNIFVVGIGETASAFSYGSSGSYINIQSSLLGYQKVAQTEQGTIHPDSFFGITNQTKDSQVLEQLTVYPNPARGGNMYLRCENCPLLESVEWVDISGRVLKTVQNPALQTAIPVDDLPKGLYFLRIHAAGDIVAMEKVVLR